MNALVAMKEKKKPQQVKTGKDPRHELGAVSLLIHLIFNYKSCNAQHSHLSV